MNTTRGSPPVVHNSNYVVNHIDRPTRDIWICSLKSSPQNPTPRSTRHLGLLSQTPLSSPPGDALVVILPDYKI